MNSIENDDLSKTLKKLFICPSVIETQDNTPQTLFNTQLKYYNENLKSKDNWYYDMYDNISMEQIYNYLNKKNIIYVNEEEIKKEDLDLYQRRIRNATFDILKQELINEKTSDDCNYHHFSGQNCDECEGWDGVSRRCECGNRRVDWEFRISTDNLEDAYIYGEAY